MFISTQLSKTTRILQGLVLSCTLISTMLFAHSNHDYTSSDHWTHLADGSTLIGTSHGEIDVAADGTFYVSIVQDANKQSGVKKFSAAGDFLGFVPNSPNDFHGFVIHADKTGQEYIYGAQLNAMRLIKMDLDGKVILNIDAVETVPKKYHATGLDKKNRVKSPMKLTAMAVDSDNNMYVVDGYSLDYIHKFDASGHYLTTFGGQDSPYEFRNCHKIHIDPRFTPNRLLCTDRINGRLVHMDLNGDLIGDHATHLRRPSAVDFYGDLAAVAEISGRVSLINKLGKTVKTLGTNDTKSEINTNRTKPEKWQKGLLTSPHGITFDHNGDIFITEWNRWGRIVRFDLSGKDHQ